jgi:5-methylcytosine-specific restriction endonuclease McrA
MPTEAELAGMSRKRRYYYRHRDREIALADRRRRRNLPRYRDLARETYRDDPAKFRERKRLERLANPEPARARSRRFQRENPARCVDYASARRARRRDGFVEHVSALVVLEVSDGICGICGEHIELADFQLDHVLSLVGGGEHSYQNVQAAHRSCNQQKGAR